ncbi:cadherin EGF LAG seven-pass G-type receptor 2-like [Anneissia japonica]|uniref:cadherin EGF LAG seven-pass G-type receptor 2-like n=1 Tax=Anneissia japonica TaxID=1529436 RepID=UPI0014254F86|nr:cadherin EGF LAG seven-pass G-type receptor 2-like [Anneissia japonica]
MVINIDVNEDIYIELSHFDNDYQFYHNLLVFETSFLLSSDLAKLNASEPIIFEDSSVSVYPIGAVFGLDLFASDGSKLSAKTNFFFPINLTTPLDNALYPESKLDLICVFFDHGTRMWSTDRLTTGEVSNVSIECKSEHTTSFSIMMRVTKNENLYFERVLSYISGFCLGISISMSLPTFMVLLYVRELRLSTRFIIVRNAILCVFLRDCTFLISDRIAELKIKVRFFFAWT